MARFLVDTLYRVADHEIVSFHRMNAIGKLELSYISLCNCISQAKPPVQIRQNMSSFRHPVAVVSHGPELYPNQNLPKRILFVSAHFEAKGNAFEISNAANPDLIFDYYGFDDEAYAVNYPAKGDPSFALKVKEQLEKNNLKAKLVNRGFDHGLFVPMSLIRPQADIPIVTMSINLYFGSQTHFDVGKALTPFREEDTLIMCSGQSTHNLHSRSPVLIEGARAFQNWLDETLSSESKLSLKECMEEVVHWRDEPASRYAHPTPDHFMPFLVAAGAGMEEKEPGAKVFFGGWAIGHISFANYVWRI